MLAAVKTRRTEFTIDIPARELNRIRDRYAITQGRTPVAVPIEDSAWYQGIAEATTPGEAMRLYRENRRMTQGDLARLLGKGVSRQRVSDQENGRRAISRRMAKRLAEIFSTSPARFI